MAPDYSANTKGPAFESTREFLITYIVTFACVILFMILFKIHFARQETMTDVTSTADTLVSQVTPLLGITLCESTQLQSTNTPEDVEEILDTRAFQRYVDTPIQTLDGIVVNQPKHFLPLAQEAKKIAEEIRIEKINEQWAGIP